MANKIQAWTQYGPRLNLGDPMTSDELIENIILATNQSRGSVLAMLAELDVQIEAGLKSRRIVQLPNGTHYKPVGKVDGRIKIKVRINPSIKDQVNIGFRGNWINAENIGIDESEIIAQWDADHPDDLIET